MPALCLKNDKVSRIQKILIQWCPSRGDGDRHHIGRRNTERDREKKLTDIIRSSCRKGMEMGLKPTQGSPPLLKTLLFLEALLCHPRLQSKDISSSIDHASSERVGPIIPASEACYLLSLEPQLCCHVPEG